MAEDGQDVMETGECRKPTFLNPNIWVDDNRRLMMSIAWPEIYGWTFLEIDRAGGARVGVDTRDGPLELSWRYLGVVKGQVLFEAVAGGTAQTKAQQWPVVELLMTWCQPEPFGARR